MTQPPAGSLCCSLPIPPVTSAGALDSPAAFALPRSRCRLFPEIIIMKSNGCECHKPLEAKKKSASRAGAAYTHEPTGGRFPVIQSFGADAAACPSASAHGLARSCKHIYTSLAQVQYMDATVAAEPTGYTINPLATLGERVSALEGTIENQNRIFDMLHEGQKNLMVSIAELRSETSTRIAEIDLRINETNERIAAMDLRITDTNERISAMELGINERIAAMELGVNERINETNERIAAMELGVNERIAGMGAQLNTKIDSNLKWMIGIQIAMWVTIIVAVLL